MHKQRVKGGFQEGGLLKSFVGVYNARRVFFDGARVISTFLGRGLSTESLDLCIMHGSTIIVWLLS